MFILQDGQWIDPQKQRERNHAKRTHYNVEQFLVKKGFSKVEKGVWIKEGLTIHIIYKPYKNNKMYEGE